MTEGAQCLQAAQHYHTTSEDAEALRAAVRAMRSILEGYACQAPGLCHCPAQPWLIAGWQGISSVSSLTIQAVHCAHCFICWSVQHLARILGLLRNACRKQCRQVS